MAASEAAKEAVYTSRFLRELGVSDVTSDAPSITPNAARLGVDNKGAIELAYNPQHHDRSKHIDRRHFKIRELVQDATLRVKHIASHKNIADIFTKPLDKKVFMALRAMLLNMT